jgi:hypothetical protein
MTWELLVCLFDVNFRMMWTYHVSEDEADGPPVEDGKLEGLGFAHALVTCGVGLNTAALETSNGNGTFALSQALAVGREVEEDEGSADGPYDRRSSFYDEQPPPTVYGAVSSLSKVIRNRIEYLPSKSASSLHATSNGTSKKTTKSS